MFDIWGNIKVVYGVVKVHPLLIFFVLTVFVIHLVVGFFAMYLSHLLIPMDEETLIIMTYIVVIGAVVFTISMSALTFVRNKKVIDEQEK